MTVLIVVTLTLLFSFHSVSQAELHPLTFLDGVWQLPAHGLRQEQRQNFGHKCGGPEHDDRRVPPNVGFGHRGNIRGRKATEAGHQAGGTNAGSPNHGRVDLGTIDIGNGKGT